MKLVVHDDVSREAWREGVLTRMLVSAEAGSAQLTVFEQWCDPGTGAPPHRHAVEEVLTVVSGEAEITVGGETATAATGSTVIVPAGRLHGFRNVGGGVLHMRAILASPVFEAQYEDARESPRRWLPPD